MSASRTNSFATLQSAELYGAEESSSAYWRDPAGCIRTTHKGQVLQPRRSSADDRPGSERTCSKRSLTESSAFCRPGLPAIRVTCSRSLGRGREEMVTPRGFEPLSPG